MRTVLLLYSAVVRRVSSGVRLETGERVKRSPVSFNCTHFTPVGVECQAVKMLHRFPIPRRTIYNDSRLVVKNPRVLYRPSLCPCVPALSQISR